MKYSTATKALAENLFALAVDCTMHLTARLLLQKCEKIRIHLILVR